MSKEQDSEERAVLSSKGQVTIPKSFRDALGLKAGSVLVFHTYQGKLLAEKDHGQAPIGKWRRRGKLPRGLNVDQYLAKVRDADRS